MDWLSEPHRARSYDSFDTHPLFSVAYSTRTGPVTVVIPSAGLVGNFVRPGSAVRHVAEKYGGTIRFQRDVPTIHFSSSDAGDAARQFIEAAAAPRHRHPANHDQSGGRV